VKLTRTAGFATRSASPAVGQGVNTALKFGISAGGLAYSALACFLSGYYAVKNLTSARTYNSSTVQLRRFHDDSAKNEPDNEFCKIASGALLKKYQRKEKEKATEGAVNLANAAAYAISAFGSGISLAGALGVSGSIAAIGVLAGPIGWAALGLAAFGSTAVLAYKCAKHFRKKRNLNLLLGVIKNDAKAVMQFCKKQEIKSATARNAALAEIIRLDTRKAFLVLVLALQKSISTNANVKIEEIPYYEIIRILTKNLTVEQMKKLIVQPPNHAASILYGMRIR
jgi:hypothetical protein